jgi:cob(I)alamin adenosyltransferase
MKHKIAHDYTKHARIHVYTGDGEGKTTTALGLALRAVGHKHKVVVVQFLKGRKYVGEYKIKSLLKPYYEIYQFGREHFIDIKKPTDDDKRMARKAFEFAKKVVEEKKPDLLVLDEINLAMHAELIDVDEVIKWLESLPKEITVVLTGRKAPKKVIKLADLVTVMRKVKHPYDEGMPAEEGVEY